MADINQQTEELARTFEQLTRELSSYNQLRKGTADQQRDAEIEAATGIKNFTKGAVAGADAVGELAGAAVSAGKAMLEGKKGAAAFNESLDGLAKAATAAGVALTLLVPGGAIIKGVVAGFTALTAATIGMVKASNDMADKLYKGYSGLAKSGAAASDGMTGVFNDAKKLGLSMNELDSFVGQVGENAGDLALFAGSVFEGRKQFADIGAAMEPYRKQMIAAGFTQEQINESTMGYIRLQTRMGQAQNKTTVELAQGAKKYLEEQDALTKLTGQTRKEMEDQNARALQQQQFASKIRELEMTNQQESADALMKLNTMYGAMGPKTQAAFQASITGNLANADALDINIQSQAEMLRTASLVASGQMKAEEAAQITGMAIGKFNDEVNIGLAGVNAGIGSFAEGEKARQLTAGAGIVENMKKIEEQQRLQGLKGGKNADAITQQYAETIKKQQELNEKFERTVFKGIDNALAITDRLANATDVVATGFEKLGTVVNRLLNIIGLGVKEPVEAPKPKTAREAEAVAAVSKERSLAEPLEQLTATKRKQLEADEKALMDAKRAGKFGDDLKPLEEKIIKSKEDYATASKDLAEQQKKVVDATREERKVKMQQKQDQNRLMLLEGINIRETEGIARLNVEKADLAAKGVDTAKKDQKIAEFKASIEERNKQIATIKQRLAPVAPSAGAAPTSPAAAPAAGGAATAPAPAPAGAAAPVAVGTRGMNLPTGSTPKDVSYRDYIKFTDGTGSEQHFNKLTEPVATAFAQMARDYNQLSGGKKLQINSAYRSPEEQAAVNPGNNPKAAPGMSLHQHGRAIDIQSTQVREMDSNGLLKQYGFKTLDGDPPHIFMRDGGVATGPDSGYPATLHGTEAVIPLKNGAVPVNLDMKNANETKGISSLLTSMNKLGSNKDISVSDMSAIKDIVVNNKSEIPLKNGTVPVSLDMSAIKDIVVNNTSSIPLKNGAVPVSLDMKNAMQPGGIGPTFAGMNEYTGYNMGPMTTDLSAIKDIAAKLGAYDASTKLITDPTTWKQILSSGIATNYDLGMAEIGTKMIPGIGSEIGDRIKELKELNVDNTDTASLIKQVTDEFKSAMLEAVRNMSGGDNAAGGEQLMLLTELVREQRNANDISSRILQVSSN